MKKTFYCLTVIILVFIIFLLILGYLIVEIKAASVPEIVISEIMYNPQGSDTGSEWLEIANISTSTPYVIDGQWRFNDGSNHLLTVRQGGDTLAPGQLAVLTSNSDLFLQNHQGYQGILVNAAMSLNNTADVLALSIDAGHTLFATTTYQADGGSSDNGYSLERINLSSDNWQSSYILGGTPGQINSQPLAEDSTNQPFVLDLGPNRTGVIGQALTFSASTTNPLNLNFSFIWDFGDQGTSSGQIVTHAYQQAGQYQVLLAALADTTLATATAQVIITQPGPAEQEEDNQENKEEAAEQVNHQVLNNTSSYSNSIIINELLPNPQGGDNENEYIELYNLSSETVDLAGWQLGDLSQRKYTISHSDFSYTAISAFGYFIIYRKESGLALNNSGDTVKLYQPDNHLLNQVTYSGAALAGWTYAQINNSWRWTALATPFSQNMISQDDPEKEEELFLEDLANASAKPEHQALGQTAIVLVTAADNNDLYRGLRINEFLPNPQGSDEFEWIELYNNSSTTLNLSGFKADDEEGGSRPYDFAASTTISGFSYLMVNKKESRLSLNNTQDSVRLLNPAGQVLTAVDYQQPLEGQSYNFNSTDEEWFWSTKVSPGKANLPVELELALADGAAEAASQEDVSIPVSITEIKSLPKGSKIKTVGAISSPLGQLGKRTAYLVAVDLAEGFLVAEEGIQLYTSNPGLLAAFKVGDVLELTGQISEALGEKRINLTKESQLKLLKNLAVVKPPVMAIGELDDALSGGLVTISGELVKKQAQDYYLDDATGEIKVSLKFKEILGQPAVKEGYLMEATGILTLTKDGYRLLPRFKEDLNFGQILGETENSATTSNELIKIEPTNQGQKVFKYLLMGGGSLLAILASLIVKLKFF